MEDVDRCEEELIEYAIRESIRDVSIDRYSENGEDYMKVLFAHPAKSLSPLPDLVYPYLNSIPTVSGDYLRIVTAIEQGDVCTLQELSGLQAFTERDSRGWLPLHRAAVLSQEQVLDQVLQASCDVTVDDVTSDGDTALILAAQEGLLENVRTLLQHGASPHKTNSLNESPLLLAVRQGSYDMVSTLIICGAFVEQVCLKKWMAIHEAAKVGCRAILVLLLRHGAKVTAVDGHNVTPLGIAAEYAHAEVLDILIKNGGDVNAQAYNGDTVLYDAAGSGNMDCISLLLQAGANPNIASLACQLPIHRAAYEGHILALRTFIPITTKRAIRLSGQSPVHSAADGGHVDCLELLIEKGFDVNAQLDKHISENYGDMRRSPLYFAVSNSDLTCTEMLLAAGAKTDLDPLRCFLVAVRAGRYELVRLLLSRGAEVNCYFRMISDTLFPTALQYCLRDHMILRLLLNNGYDVDKCFMCNHGNGQDMDCDSWVDYQNNHRRTLFYNENCRASFCEIISLSSVVNLAGSVVQMLLDYIRHPRICPNLLRVLEKQKEWPDICDILDNPRSLQHQCRLVIRRQMTPRRLNDPQVMAAVPFPPSLKHYLTYREYDEYGGLAATHS
ncbi:ankyrin repeat and SOCS box protein 15 isoform X1 [Salmo salar]|uniref:Ankyrin repeat and SOCS box protein 15 isoform X1 n=1 Tax=Salmo salar TaxID=8030 RepID=A0ABM3F3Q6_SALSA|nr:ankyrin repeat and SOCS box protein 15-like isoform X1 [Salmo salar]